MRLCFSKAKRSRLSLKYLSSSSSWPKQQRRYPQLPLAPQLTLDSLTDDMRRRILFVSDRFEQLIELPGSEAASYKSVLSGGPKSSSNNRFWSSSSVKVESRPPSSAQEGRPRFVDAIPSARTATMRHAVFIDDAAFARAFLVCTMRDVPTRRLLAFYDEPRPSLPASRRLLIVGRFDERRPGLFRPVH